MARTRAWIGVLLLVLATLALAGEVADDEYADTYKASLIVHKAVEDKSKDLSFPLVVQGRNATVVITLTNVGSGPAENVDLKDSLPSNAQLLAGSLTATFPKISSGSSVTHSYVIVFTSGGSLEVAFLPPASVSYKSEEETIQTGSSTRAGVFVVSVGQQITRYALLAGAYASLGICRTPSDWRNMGIFLGVIGALLGFNFGYKAMGTRTSSSKRKKALAELEKED